MLNFFDKHRSIRPERTGDGYVSSPSRRRRLSAVRFSSGTRLFSHGGAQQPRTRDTLNARLPHDTRRFRRRYYLYMKYLALDPHNNNNDCYSVPTRRSAYPRRRRTVMPSENARYHYVCDISVVFCFTRSPHQLRFRILATSFVWRRERNSALIELDFRSAHFSRLLFIRY